MVSEMEVLGSCGICGVSGNAARFVCTSCRLSRYCSKDHQVAHWRSHKMMCNSFRIVSSPNYGQYLVASKIIESGIVLLMDTPLVVGPIPNCSCVCLGCNDLIDEDSVVWCPNCKWPMCSEKCVETETHIAECKILSNEVMKNWCPIDLEDSKCYDLILVLRILVLQTSNQAVWNIIDCMANHVMKRFGKEDPDHMAMTISEYLSKLGFEKEVVHRIYAIIATNAQGVKSPKGVCLRALYNVQHYLNHSCVPNIQLTNGKNSILQIRTAVDIREDEPLFATYIATTLPSWQRYKILKEEYYFECECKRCLDPTEFGTYFSSNMCPKCHTNFLIPEKNSGSFYWRCGNCNATQTLEDIEPIINKYLLIAQNWYLPTPVEIKRVIEDIEREFHPQHYLWMRVSQIALVHLHDNNSEVGLSLRFGLLTRLLALYDLFEPGLTRRRGTTLLEIATVRLQTALKDYKDALRLTVLLPTIIPKLQEIQHILEDAHEILNLEPTSSRAFWMKDVAKDKKRIVLELKKKVLDQVETYKNNSITSNGVL